MYFIINTNGQKAAALMKLRKFYCLITLDESFDLSGPHLLLGK